MKKYQCPCCGYFTYNVPANEDCGVYLSRLFLGELTRLLLLITNQVTLIME